MMPVFMVDMPLLPPNPPFMLQQYPNPRKTAGSTPSLSKRSSGAPTNHSSERVDQMDQRPRTPSKSTSSIPRQVQSPSHPPPSFRRQSSNSDNASHRSLGGKPRVQQSASQTLSYPQTRARPPSQYAPSSFSMPPPFNPGMLPRTTVYNTLPNVARKPPLNRRP